MPFEFIDHTGDTAVELSARSEAELVGEAARALAAILVDTERGRAPRPLERLAVEIEAEDGETLLVDLLNELIFRFDTARFLASDVEVMDLSLGRPARLRGLLLGETFDPGRHVFQTEVKAATFHGVEIRRGEDGLGTTVVFDL